MAFITRTPCRLRDLGDDGSIVVIVTTIRPGRRWRLKGEARKVPQDYVWLTSYLPWNCTSCCFFFFTIGGTAMVLTFCWSPRSKFMTTLRLDKPFWFGLALTVMCSTSYKSSCTLSNQESSRVLINLKAYAAEFLIFLSTNYVLGLIAMCMSIRSQLIHSSVSSRPSKLPKNVSATDKASLFRWVIPITAILCWLQSTL